MCVVVIVVVVTAAVVVCMCAYIGSEGGEGMRARIGCNETRPQQTDLVRVRGVQVQRVEKQPRSC